MSRMIIFGSSALENLHAEKDGSMKKESHEKMKDELRPEYDLSQLLRGGVQGKYAKRFRAGTNLASLPDDGANASSGETVIKDNPRPPCSHHDKSPLLSSNHRKKA